VLPGETTFNAGAVLAANGELGIGLVVCSCAATARAGLDGSRRRLPDRRAGPATVRERGPVFLLFGRYIPGERFALNATLGGVVRMPYPTFVFWSAINGTLCRC
jgi:membrane protein DedA with SNARE-associated domain